MCFSRTWCGCFPDAVAVPGLYPLRFICKGYGRFHSPPVRVSGIMASANVPCGPPAKRGFRAVVTVACVG